MIGILAGREGLEPPRRMAPVSISFFIIGTAFAILRAVKNYQRVYQFRHLPVLKSKNVSDTIHAPF